MVAILMATYNGEKYLEEQIQSILNQSFIDYKLYIRDDGSTDNTLNIIEKYSKIDSRIILLQDDYGNLGFAQNFITMLKNVHSDYYFFSDQDDIWMKNKIELLMEAMINADKDKKPVLVHCDSYLFSNDEKSKKSKRFLGNGPLKKGLKNSFFKYMVQGSNMVINSSLRNKAIKNSEEIKIHDRYIHFISEIFGIRIYLNKSLGFYRQHTDNILGAKTKISRFLEMIRKKSGKNFYDNDDLMLRKIYLYYNSEIDQGIKDNIKGFFYITNKEISKIKRFIYMFKNQYYIPFSKKIIMLIKY